MVIDIYPNTISMLNTIKSKLKYKYKIIFRYIKVGISYRLELVMNVLYYFIVDELKLVELEGFSD